MTKSELIEVLARKQKHLPAKDVELAVKHLLDLMSDSLATGQRIAHQVEQVLDRQLDILRRQMLLLSGQNFDQL